MKTILLSLGLLLILSGCGYKEGVVTTSSKTYLYFTGNVNNAYVSIDGGQRFAVESAADHQYSLKPGKHLIEVFRNGNKIVKREIFTSDGIAKEIEVH